MAFENDVFRLEFVYKFQLVGHAGTATGLYTETDAHPLASFGEEIADVLGSLLAERNALGSNRAHISALVFLLVVGDRGLDGIFSKDRAVNFHWRQGKFYRDLGVLDVQGLVDRLALDPFGHEGA